MKTNEEILATWETEGIYTNWYAIDSYDPVDGKTSRLFVGTEADAIEMMNRYYAKPTDLAMQPFRRCSLIATEAAKDYFDGIAVHLAENDPRDDWISAAEAAEILHVHRNRVLQLVNSGDLEGRKIGGTWIVDRASVEARAANPPHAGRRW